MNYCRSQTVECVSLSRLYQRSVGGRGAADMATATSDGYVMIPPVPISSPFSLPALLIHYSLLICTLTLTHSLTYLIVRAHTHATCSCIWTHTHTHMTTILTYSMLHTSSYFPVANSCYWLGLALCKIIAPSAFTVV